LGQLSISRAKTTNRGSLLVARRRIASFCMEGFRFLKIPGICAIENCLGEQFFKLKKYSCFSDYCSKSKSDCSGRCVWADDNARTSFSYRAM